MRIPQERLRLVESVNVRRRRSREHRCEQCHQLVHAAGDKFSDPHRSSMTAPTCSNGPTTAPMLRTNQRPTGLRAGPTGVCRGHDRVR